MNKKLSFEQSIQAGKSCFLKEDFRLCRDTFGIHLKSNTVRVKFFTGGHTPIVSLKIKILSIGNSLDKLAERMETHVLIQDFHYEPLAAQRFVIMTTRENKLDCHLVFITNVVLFFC